MEEETDDDDEDDEDNEEEEEDGNDKDNKDNEEEEFFGQKCLKLPDIPACQIWWGYLKVSHDYVHTTSDNKDGRTSD